MAADPSDVCPNEECGGPRDACGCPSDLHTQTLMVCLPCGGRWWRAWGDRSTRCPHPDCGRDLSLVSVPPAYPPERTADDQPHRQDDEMEMYG